MKIFLKEIKDRFPEFEIRNYDEKAYFTGFNHDSRAIKTNEIFIPIKGENFDGHDFILPALSNGASMSLCESKNSLMVKDVDKPIVFVDSIQEGLQKVLNYATSSIAAPIIAITGSTGKTTTRQMLATILEEDGDVLTSDHANTVWGNAALLSQYTNEKYIVLECGMDRAGEIAWHVNSVDPDLGILLNIGYVHAEKLGSIEKIYEEKKNLADYLNKTGKPLILNIDDDRLARIPQYFTSELITFGKSADANFKISNINVSKNGTDFVLTKDGISYDVHINAFGEGPVYDAIAAIAAANKLGLDMQSCVKGISEFIPNSGRFEQIELENGNMIINDAYNANPASMEMSLTSFNQIYPEDKYFRVVILGDMKELGEVTISEHKKLGDLVKNLNFNKTYYLGDYFEAFNYGEKLNSITDAVAVLKKILKTENNVAILLKASHSVGLFEVPSILRSV